MALQFRGVAKYGFFAGLIIAGIFVFPTLRRYLSPEMSQAADAAPAMTELVAGKDALQVPAEVAARLGVQTAAVQSSTAPVPLDLPGTLMLDADRLSHVHARFAGEIVEIGNVGGKAVGFGQRVRKGQLLAVLWSHDLGEKKSELLDGLSQLRVDEDLLARIRKAATEGAIPERMIDDTQRKVEADRIVVSRAVRTLQSWRIAAEEIAAVRAEATRLTRDKVSDRDDLFQAWARVEVRAPLDGVVIERNVALGDLVDTTSDLFKVADLSRLRVVAHAYEEDLPRLDALQGDHRAWSVTIGSDTDTVTRPGRFEQVGCIIDPNQHTAMVMGWVDSADAPLRVGQFVTAHLLIPPPKSEVVIPAAALCEEGGRTTVFLRPEGTQDYVRQAVIVARRSGDKVYLRNQLTAAERARGLQPLLAGQLVVTSRVAQLTANLNALKSAGGHVADKAASDKPGA